MHTLVRVECVHHPQFKHKQMTVMRIEFSISCQTIPGRKLFITFQIHSDVMNVEPITKFYDTDTGD